jgi:hypothetical protein
MHSAPSSHSFCSRRAAFECEKRFSAADDIGAAAALRKGLGLVHFFIRQISTVAAHYHLPEPLFLCS